MATFERGLATVLGDASRELTDLATLADQLGVVGLADVERWQSLDKLSQHLAGLAAFLFGLSEVVPDVEADLRCALAAVKTKALADRLAGQPNNDEGVAGEIELFGA